ncbi:unnamed protein product [Angiostrongylus costaricensis]|uniref:SAC domain-containing protein n=1 Tax=Angiostrongylus costaricensis TaxID=334426 RepID=A0A0R3PQ04_ANGCS|nr:unnamed protein product [Angiostrongylus costaricensis]
MRGRIRRVTVYETIDRFYIVGCDVSGMRFRLLKLDRIDSKVLLAGEPECDYTKEEILELLATVTESNFGKYVRGISGRSNRKDTQGLVERISNAFGLLGVVKFLEGYYIIVVTKANIVATLGYHYIYKIAEVAMISLAVDASSPSSEEQRYVKLFQSVDLSTDFYFSYTYDLSRSLQENIMSTHWDKDGRRQLISDQKFVWNSFLLEPLRNNLVSEHWLLEIVHGSLELHLFRSQILWDVSSSPNFSFGRFSAFVQRRGSVPLRWSQDPATRGVVGKPLIRIDIHEPHAQTAAAHFRVTGEIWQSHNCNESGENTVFKAVNYLNQFLPLSENICYLSFDVARCNKLSSVSSNVLTKMEEIGFKAVQAHGWFQSFPMPYTRSIDYRPSLPDFKPLLSGDKRFLLQQGISRTNCVDCLDRTNVAQFVLGRVALACQLYAMGVLDNPCLLCLLLTFLLSSIGCSWQYAGSQLVHSIKTYKKISAFQERSRDVIQTLSRYYSNTFGDYDKQAAINLFLGVTTDYCAWMYDDDYLEKMISTEYDRSEAQEEQHDYAKIREANWLSLETCLRPI